MTEVKLAEDMQVVQKSVACHTWKCDMMYDPNQYRHLHFIPLMLSMEYQVAQWQWALY